MRYENQKIVYSWAMYDWANSAFATTIMAAVLPTYYSAVAGADLDPATASSYWGYTNTLIMIIVAFLSPFLGALADYKQSKKRYLTFFAVWGAIFTGMLYYVQQGDWLLASVLYIAARMGFAGANVFYDSLLPHVAGIKTIDRVSSLGYAAGYLGGGLLLALNLAMIMLPEVFGIPDSQTGTRLSFVTVTVWWLVFSIPLLKNVPEPIDPTVPVKTTGAAKAAFEQLINTFRHIRKYKQAFRFLIAFWLYNDGIGTIITMAVIFGAEIGIGQEHLIGAILTVQFVGIPFTILFGRLAEKISGKNAIYIGLIIYACISIGGYFMQNALHFWMLAIVIGMVQGGTQALSRSMFGSMIPLNKSAEFFGFFDVSQKFSGILGPAIFGLVAQLTGTSRMSILALIVFFSGGMLILKKVNVEEGILSSNM